MRSRLLELPAELRLLIHELALKEDFSPRPLHELENFVEVQRWELEPDYGDQYRVVRPATPRPTLLGVNRQIRFEALPVYYSINTFSAASSTTRLIQI
jgi:hypothetical protein